MDLTGQIFGFYSVVSKAQSDLWDCKCKCGTTRKVRRSDLVKGKTKSCGCRRSAITSKCKTKHGERIGGGKKTPEFEAWSGIKKRCYNPKSTSYKNYGGRGIKVCDRWLNSFENFLEDMGRKPDLKHSIERKDFNGDYEPLNCVWASREAQSRNKRTNRFYEYKGERKVAKDWASEYALTESAVKQRLGKLSWPIERALLTPLQTNKKSRQVAAFVE